MMSVVAQLLAGLKNRITTVDGRLGLPKIAVIPSV